MEPTEYALTTIHGPAGPGDVIVRGDPVPDTWPAPLRAELRQHGAVSTERPEVYRGVYPPPLVQDLKGRAEREHYGRIG